MATLGIVGGNDILLWLLGVMGDRSEDCECEDWECISPRLEEFLRRLPEVVELDLFREKRPMLIRLLVLAQRTAGPVIVGCVDKQAAPDLRIGANDVRVCDDRGCLSILCCGRRAADWTEV